MKRNIRTFVITSFLILTSQLAFAGSATWNLNPISNDWNNAANWTPNTVPNGPSDTATFGSSTITDVTVSSSVQLGGIVFDPGAPSYSIAPANDLANLTLNSSGMTNNSGVSQNLGGTVDSNSESYLMFNGSASAGHLITVTQSFSFSGVATASDASFVLGDTFNPSSFNGSATAAQANFDVSNNGIIFGNSSTAADAVFILHGTTGDKLGGIAQFEDQSTAGNASFTVYGSTSAGSNGRGGVFFEGAATADNSTIVVNGGTNGGAGGYVSFASNSTGGAASITLLGNATLDNLNHDDGVDVTIGSLAGEGMATLSQNNINIGSNSQSTTFSGLIQDSGAGCSITKIGRGTWTLTGTNTYTGSTRITSGALLVRNKAGSGTGASAVQVRGGTLGGTGTIAGTLVAGDSRTPSGIVKPSAGSERPGHLTVQSAITFQGDGIYACLLDPKHVVSDKLSANGVTINAGAQFMLTASTNKALRQGTVFAVLDNTGASPISGTFSNLSDGATVTLGQNTFLAKYTGGDGNDLTLTVVP